MGVLEVVKKGKIVKNSENRQKIRFYVIYIYAYTSTIPWPIQYPETTPIPDLSENGLILMADLINWLHCHTTSSLPWLNPASRCSGGAGSAY